MVPGGVRRRVCGEVDDVKMQSAGIRGTELMWITGSMVLLYFANLEARVKEMAKGSLTTWFHSVEPWSADISY
ncbi:hypothetical protein V6N11_039210 [Hibiscus sabdariffa]|uniref:Uncharacterized protein n=1 Tax=Hibiscus sabdariffa TaxID=183260 RepID=A0ABR2SMD1_9ROSI